MSEFYLNKSDEQIRGITEQKMLPFEGFIDGWLKIHDIDIKEDDLLFSVVKKYFEIKGNMSLKRYIGVNKGIEVYHFYNACFTETEPPTHWGPGCCGSKRH